MSKHPFRVAMETNANKKDLGKLFAGEREIPEWTAGVSWSPLWPIRSKRIAKVAGTYLT